MKYITVNYPLTASIQFEGYMYDKISKIYLQSDKVQLPNLVYVDAFSNMPRVSAICPPFSGYEYPTNRYSIDNRNTLNVIITGVSGVGYVDVILFNSAGYKKMSGFGYIIQLNYIPYIIDAKFTPSLYPVYTALPTPFAFNVTYSTGVNFGITSSSFSSTLSTHNDKIGRYYTPATAGNTYTLSTTPTIYSAITADTVTYYSSNTAVATISGNKAFYNYITGGVSGVITLSAIGTYNNSQFTFTNTVPSNLTFTQSYSGENPYPSLSVYGDLASRRTPYFQILSGAIPNTTRFVATTAVDSRIANKSPSTALSIFSTQNASTSSFIRNTNCWAYDIDLTCFSPWNSNGSNQQAGTLITPRHIVYAKHFEYGIGTRVWFITKTNQIVSRTLVAKYDTVPPDYDDICIGALDSDVPSSISYCKFLPYSLSANIPNKYFADSLEQIPVIRTNQFKEAMVGDLSFFSYSPYYAYSICQTPVLPQRISFYKDVIGGDSGSPCFIIINNEPVILTLWHFGGSGYGPNYTALQSGINDGLSALDIQTGTYTGYRVTNISLSGFTSF